ncbi:MAG: hypothetical protein LQ350_001875 [Teloschistes chrysophthalmus]|nr:MAG: hypothetical protein LQ350_001875 [Niorma chrysophthalma]
MSETQELTFKDVASHNSKKDLYVVIHDKVYDATKFIDEHPGGEEVLLDVGGQDATEAFEDVGHSDEARTILDGLEKAALKRMPGDPAGYQESPKHFSSQPSSSSSGGGAGAGMGVMFYAILLVGAGLAYGAFQYLQANGGKEAGGKA